VAEEVGPQYRFLHIGDEEDPLELSVECQVLYHQSVTVYWDGRVRCEKGGLRLCRGRSLTSKCFWKDRDFDTGVDEFANAGFLVRDKKAFLLCVVVYQRRSFGGKNRRHLYVCVFLGASSVGVCELFHRYR
jgi:hypothetical protein